jgi:hypothetical protein
MSCSGSHLGITINIKNTKFGSLCTVSTLSITTKTKEDEVSLTYVINNQGQITSSHPSHLSQGKYLFRFKLSYC